MHIEIMLIGVHLNGVKNEDHITITKITMET